jgi:hypothetical protein
MTNLAQLRLGTAPDSWGVWFPSDPHQVGWQQYLDEVAKAGYLYTELGPQGFLPQDPAQLNDELAARGLTVSGGTVFAGLHKGKEALDKAIEDFGREAKLLAAVGSSYLVHLPEQAGIDLVAAQRDPLHRRGPRPGDTDPADGVARRPVRRGLDLHQDRRRVAVRPASRAADAAGPSRSHPELKSILVNKEQW